LTEMRINFQVILAILPDIEDMVDKLHRGWLNERVVSWPLRLSESSDCSLPTSFDGLVPRCPRQIEFEVLVESMLFRPGD